MNARCAVYGRIGCRIAGGTCAVALMVSLAGGAARASAANGAGTARVVKPTDLASGTLVDLAAGGSATPFTLALPGRSACKGDSANDGYRVQSYMVPSSVDPATLRFGSAGPLPEPGRGFRQPLYSLTTDPYVNKQTANADRPGDPGYIINISAFNFGVFTTGQVPSGTYNVGIACTKGPAAPTQLEKFWNVVLTVIADPLDKPAGMAWRTAGARTPAAGTAATTAPDPAASPPSQPGAEARTSSLAGRPASVASDRATGGAQSGGVGPLSATGQQPPAAAPSVAVEARPGPDRTQPGGPPTAAPVLLAVAQSTPLLSGSSTSLVVWAGLLLIFSRMGLLFARPLRVLAVKGP